MKEEGVWRRVLVLRAIGFLFYTQGLGALCYVLCYDSVKCVL